MDKTPEYRTPASVACYHDWWFDGFLVSLMLKEFGNREAIVGMPTKQETTWAQHGGRVDTHDKKARMHHLEAVQSCIMRARDRDKEHLVRGRE